MSCSERTEILNKMQQQNFVTQLSSNANRPEEKEVTQNTQATAKVSGTVQSLAESNRNKRFKQARDMGATTGVRTGRGTQAAVPGEAGGWKEPLA